MPPEVPVYDVTHGNRGDQGSGAVGDVAEAEVERGEVVCSAVEIRDYTDGDHHACEEESVIQQDYAALLLKANFESGEGVWQAKLPLRRHRGDYRRVFETLLPGDVPAYQRALDAGGWDGPVSDDFAAGFRKEGDEEDEEGAGEDGEEPEYAAPASILDKDAADCWAKAGAHEDAKTFRIFSLKYLRVKGVKLRVSYPA